MVELKTAIWSVQQDEYVQTSEKKCNSDISIRFVNKGEAQVMLNDSLLLETGQELFISCPSGAYDKSIYKIRFTTEGKRNLVIIKQSV